jgi:aspartate kinase
MRLIVQKYGGTSVATPERIRAVAQRVAASRQQGDRIVVTVSAMAGETNRLLALARETSRQPQPREVDVLLATGEQAAVALLAMALRDLDCPAQSFLGHQIRISTDSAFGRARIKRIDCDNLTRALAVGRVAVVAGFQGVDEQENITTLGRGGSDTTAVAVAAALKADACEIYTDVEGVYTTDPRICPSAHKLARISFDEMLELASLGAKVLQIRSVEFAKRYGVPLHVRSSFSAAEGTWVVPEEPGMEDVLVSGVTLDRDETKITLLHVPDKPGLAAHVFGPIAAANIVVDMIIQNASAEGFTDLTFTVPAADFEHAVSMVNAVAREIGAAGVATSTDVAKVSIVGLGMRSHAGVAARMFEILAEEGINIQMISTSEIKVSVVIDAKYGELAVRVLHQALVERGAQAGEVA